jgi:hypothetical protein
MKQQTPPVNHSYIRTRYNDSDVGYMDLEWYEEKKEEQVETTK